MQDGDLATWTEHRLIIVLEGVLANIPQGTVTGLLRKHVEPAPPETWGWSKLAMKQINMKVQQNQSVDVVTFISQQVADEAAEWFSKYNVGVSEVYYADFDFFCESLSWAVGLERVIDSDMDRLNRFGQLGYRVEQGGYF